MNFAANEGGSSASSFRRSRVPRDAEKEWRQLPALEKVPSSSQDASSYLLPQTVAATDSDTFSLVQAETSPILRPRCIRERRGRRMAWADMGSDSEEEFIADAGAGFCPSSPSSSRKQACFEDAEASTHPSPRSKEFEDENERWAAEVQAIAIRLAELAANAPSKVQRRNVDVATETEVKLADLRHWEAEEEMLQTIQIEVLEARQRLADASCRAVDAELVYKTAWEAVEIAEAQYKKEQEATASELELEAALAQSTREADQRSAQRDALSSELASLRAQVERAKEEAIQSEAARQARRALPELRKRRKAAEAMTSAAEDRLKEAQGSSEQLKLEMKSVKESADARAKPLAARLLQLEAECRELSQRHSDSESATRAKAEAEAAERVLKDELQEAQARNRELLPLARKAKMARESTKSNFLELQEQVASLKASLSQAEDEGKDLSIQLEQQEQSEALAREEVDRLVSLIKESEKQVQDSEDAAKRDRAQQAEVEAKKRGLQLAKRRAEEAAAVLEWRLQKAAMQLEKEKPANSLVKCLLSGATGTNPVGLGLQRKAVCKRFSRLSSSAGSDAELESTTAASETHAECI